MLAKLWGGVVLGMETHLIEIEVEHKNGFPGFDIVGLADTAIKEAKERVSQSIRHSGFDLQFRRVLCNLAPANIKKSGAFLDLPIAIGILMSSGIIELTEIKQTLIVGELGFEGQVRPIQGALALAIMARQKGLTNIILPQDNLEEVSVLTGINIFPITTLKGAIDVLSQKVKPITIKNFTLQEAPFNHDFNEVKGQSMAKRALEIAAAGFHNFLMVGSPGVGKSMLAKRLPTIMPPLSMEEAIELTQIYSISPNKTGHTAGLIQQRPFRSPHHTSSDIAIIGGGTNPKPGEITLAHRGILFLDEFPEFKKSVFEALREPLEDKMVTISRTERTQHFPAHFLLVAAMNPCPCGYALHPTKDCYCPPIKISKYFNRISGPILDRIDLQVQMAETQYKDLQLVEESSETIRNRVMNAVNIQFKRFNDYIFNSQMTTEQINQYCVLDEQSEQVLKQSMEKFSLSMRSYTKILKIARTIADLEASMNIQMHHLLEALQYRNMEKNFMKH